MGGPKENGPPTYVIRLNKKSYFQACETRESATDVACERRECSILFRAARSKSHFVGLFTKCK